MNMDYASLVPADFSDHSRVWIYQSNRLFTLGEALQLEDRLVTFLQSWNTHGTPVKGFGNLFFGQFIVLMADETAAGVSGCSTDSSVRLIKDIEKDFGVTLFDRQLLAFLVKGKVQLIPLAQLNYAIEHRFIEPDSLYFDNTVQHKKEFVGRWITPLNSSWLAARIRPATQRVQ